MAFTHGLVEETQNRHEIARDNNDECKVAKVADLADDLKTYRRRNKTSRFQKLYSKLLGLIQFYSCQLVITIRFQM